MYSFFKNFLGIIFKLFFRCQIIGQENIPKQGGVIIAANHLSFWDPPLIGTFMPRPIHFMAKEELFKVPIFGWVIKKLNAFPVRRGAADRTAIRTAINTLEAGSCLGLFPEGTRSKNGLLGPAEPGLSMIAVKAGAAIVPTAIIGTNKIFNNGFFPLIELRFGKPIYVNKEKADKENMEKISNQIMAEIALLLDQ
ncbi:1-acyl-sn-glycerol-3-phosphate acyltransferase [Sporomusaceae bacterium FL31]|nr:1-acyl-sn-glycerol-3-phosphate acyltransferase [Sporomusaceae bacterium FL31]GCE33359.1 1-acyl-sn-glycerol-3-phosphate acyltransferase [Sporomusaceae bacterium]